MLENSNEWNLSLAKEGSSKREREKEKKKERKRKRKRKEQRLKSKRGETTYEEAPCFKKEKRKKEDEIYKPL
jgi:hypothetical protein